MQLSDAGRPRPPSNAYVRVMFFASLFVCLSCGDAPTSSSGAEMRRVTRPQLSIEAADAVALVLADVPARTSDAMEDGDARSQFNAALDLMNARLRDGLLDAAEQCATDARAAIKLAADRDADGSGDADRSAISLALDFATEEINNARLIAAGGSQ